MAIRSTFSKKAARRAAGSPISVGIIMGSQSDWPTMKAAADMLDALRIRYETRI
ncbi:MAG TPA: AIR carboxylase family protein, partial [Rhizomicrobium sp.]|nr:AIR carboxylase family protein [Rhizomicrobium sp.]